jgi:hypothetical protein
MGFPIQTRKTPTMHDKASGGSPTKTRITARELQDAFRKTPRFRSGEHNLTKLPKTIKSAIINYSRDNKLNKPNYEHFLKMTRKKEQAMKHSKAFLRKVNELMTDEAKTSLGMIDLAAELTYDELKDYLEKSPDNRKSFIIALRKLLDERGPVEKSDIMTYLQPLQEGVGGTEKDPILASMLFKGGNAFLLNYAPFYHDQIFYGTAKMAKSTRTAGTRKGKGRKGAKNGKKKTRRVRCWSRRNKEAQRYVVCSGSRGQKSMRSKRKNRSRKHA